VTHQRRFDRRSSCERPAPAVVIGAAENDVAARQQLGGRQVSNSRRDGVNRYVKTDALGCSLRDLDFRFTKLLHPRFVDPRQVRLREQVVVDDRYFADAQPDDLLKDRRARAAGADAFLRKPFDVAEVESLVQQLLAPRSNEDAAGS